jgi:glutaredoxin-like protein
MPLIGDKERQQIRDIFAKSLERPVRLVTFTQEFECEFCAQTRELVEDISGLSDLVEAQVHDLVADESIAEGYSVDKIPAIAVVGERDYGVRFYGIPSGYEFTSLMESIVNVSNGQSGLSAETRKALEGVREPVHLQVYVTPT